MHTLKDALFSIDYRGGTNVCVNVVPSCCALTLQMTPSVLISNDTVGALSDRSLSSPGGADRSEARDAARRKMARRPKLRIGVIVRTLRSLHHSLLVDSTVNALAALGMDAIVRCSQGTAAGELQVYEDLQQESPDGIIFAAEVLSDAALAELLEAHPDTLLINRSLDNLAERCVALDNRLAGQHAADLLFGHGHRNVAIVTGPQYLPDVQLRQQGFTTAMADHGYPVDEANVLVSNFRESGGATAMRTLLEHPSVPTAVFCQNDFMAIGAMHACSLKGIAVPEQISILGFDNIDTCDFLSPGLTSIHQPLRGMGEYVAQAMFRLVHGGKDLAVQARSRALPCHKDRSKLEDSLLPTGLFMPRIVQRGTVGSVPDSAPAVSDAARAFVEDAANVIPARQTGHITPRERDCLYWTAHGKTSWEIGKILGIAESTVTFHLKHAIKKLKTTNRAQAAARAVALGLFTL